MEIGDLNQAIESLDDTDFRQSLDMDDFTGGGDESSNFDTSRRSAISK
jgi:hypothetical protein